MMTTEDGREPEPADEQKRTAVWRHPRRDDILALLPKRTSEWISLWLEEEYELEDADGEPHPDARRNARLRLSPRSIESYRQRFMPEAAPGVAIAPRELEDVVGRAPPPPETGRRELEQLDLIVRAAMTNLGRAMAQDDEMEMLQPVTMEAQKQALGAVSAVIDAKAKMGVDGYRPPPQEIHQTNRNLNVDVDGNELAGRGRDRDPRSSAPGNPAAIDALHKVLAPGPEKAMELIDRARNGDAEEIVDAEVTDDAA